VDDVRKPESALRTFAAYVRSTATAAAEAGGPAPNRSSDSEDALRGGGKKTAGPTASGPPKGAGADHSGANEARLAELARDPREAHRAWKKLNADDRGLVLAKMKQRYGSTFADQFRDVAQRGKADFSFINWQPNLGPTPEKLKADGWRLLGMEEPPGNAAIDVEVWVHSSGKTLRRDVSTTPAAPPKPEKPEDEDELTKVRTKFEDIKRRIWSAMGDFDSNVQRLESKPADEDRSPIDAAIEASRKTVRNLIDELTEFSKENDGLDDNLDTEFGDEWGSAMEQYKGILARYNGLP
jgi:hypothetical protein